MSVAIDTLPPLREIIAAHDLRAEKSLGQNFLLDLNLTDKIAREALAGLDSDTLKNLTVFEIGPGPGGLTRALLKMPIKKVIAIEYDPRAVTALGSLKDASENRLEVIRGDALETNLLDHTNGPRAIIANLPYNIATPLLIGWLKQIHADPQNFELMALMFQKEVGDRIIAATNTKAYGRLAILSSWLCNARRLIDLPPAAFTPPPKISSSVIHFKPKKLSTDEKPDFKTLEKLTAAAFNQRRKMIRSSLKDYRDILDDLEIDETLRAENLSPADYIRIASKVES